MKQIESRGKASAHAVRKCHTDSLAAVKVTRETCKWHANQRRPGGGFRVDVVMAIMPDDMHDMHTGVQMLRLIDERWDRKGLKSTSLRETIPNAVERGKKFNRGNRIIWKGKHWPGGWIIQNALKQKFRDTSLLYQWDMFCSSTLYVQWCLNNENITLYLVKHTVTS